VKGAIPMHENKTGFCFPIGRYYHGGYYVIIMGIQPFIFRSF
jgi:hypothetical protein